LLYSDAICGYLEAGGAVAWGIVPADWRVFSEETLGSLYLRYCAIREEICTLIPESLFDRQSLITPTCGIRFADRNGAIAIMQATAEISLRIRQQAG